MSEKLSDRLWDLLNEATLRNELSATQLCMIDEARALAKRVEDAPIRTIARLYAITDDPGDTAHLVKKMGGKRVRLLLESDK